MGYTLPVTDRQRSLELCQAVLGLFPAAACELDYRTPWELLVATILSAQSTDIRVNTVTPELFRRWPTPHALARAPLEELEDVVRATGLYRNKARAIRECARIVVSRHGGEVPRDLDAMLELPGVGRKTANVVLGEAYGIPAGIAVDTHVRRVSRRLGLTTETAPERIEANLEALVAREWWHSFSLRLVLLGRRICTARRPACDTCSLSGRCPKVGLP
ncbi:MAG TPA: endonuclease III [Acidobacteria bacterium]|nr:endonuclease III [Acidobacteriota bacterium]